MRIFKSFLLLFFILFLFNLPSFSQEFESKVKVNVKKLPEQYKRDAVNLDKQIKNYIDRTEWTDGEIPMDINLQIDVFLESITKTFEDQYTGRFYIYSSSGSKFADIEWRFAYSQADNFTHSDFEFQSLVSLIDFHIYLILGEELDKWDELGGTPFFEKAKKLASQGTFDRHYKHWWDRRVKIAEKFTDFQHLFIRKAFFYFSLADYDYQDGEYKTAIESAHIALDNIEKVKDRADKLENIQQYFNRRHKKFSEIFSKEEDRKGLGRIIILDSSHKSFYERFN